MLRPSLARSLNSALCLAVWLLFAQLVPSIGHAEQGLDVSQGLHGASLGRQVAILEDAAASETIESISAARAQARFVASRTDTPNYGFSPSVYWVRIPVRNSANAQRTWLLALGYPHLDHVTLFLPRRAGGFERRTTGDTLPFAQRDIKSRNFLFSVEEAPRSDRVLYLRIASSGSLNIPLRAWSTQHFIEEEQVEWTVLCVFYGAIFIMAFYNVCIYGLVRQVEYLYYVAFVLSLGFLQFTLVGHTFQYLLPNHAWLANRAMPISLGLVVLSASLFAINYLHFKSFAARFTRFLGAVAAGLGAASFVISYQLVLRLLVPVSITACLVGLVEPIRYLQSGDRRAKLYLIGWGFFLAGAIASLLRFAGLVPTNFITSWSMQIGAIVQVAFLSTALADRINVMRADLANLNGVLSDKVAALQDALGLAEEATSRAERATRVKDDFMATMSHEFRTPLNAIINIPQGLLEQFPMQRFAVCGECAATFELEHAEIISAALACPECEAPASLRERHVQRYIGRPEHTARYLTKIERSGTHLLQVVDSILDFSKLEAGHLRIAREQTHVASLVQETVDQMSDLAERSGVSLHCDGIASAAFLHVDPLRIRQVLINLIGNAIKFSDGNGTVRVEVREREDTYCFSVRDQGIGIAPENLEAVFERFEQVHTGNTRKYGGTGLGLSISRSLVRMHGGDMWVESKLGQGATFFFTVPKIVASPVRRQLNSQPRSMQPEEAALTENLT